MKKISIVIVLFFCLTKIWSQSDGTLQPPQGAMLVPGTADLYTTPYDEPSRMLRNAAVSACGCKGDGWRLPTLGELQIMYSHRYEMDFSDGWYWTGEKVRGEFKFYDLNFKNGKVRESNYDKEDFVRCVWSRQPLPGSASNLQPMAPKNQPATAPASETPVTEKTQSDTLQPAPIPHPTPAASAQPISTAPQTQASSPAQADRKGKPYNSSFGIVAGCLNGLSFKVFPDDKFSISLELGVKATAAWGIQGYGEWHQYDYMTDYYYYWDWYNFTTTPYTLELNVNFLREDHFVAGLYGLIGGGPSIGWHFRNNIPYYSYDYYYSHWPRYRNNNGKAGVNLMIGLEYVFQVPIALQVDFRPGYGLIFNYEYTAHYFDWGVNLGFRYAFK